MPDVNGSSFHLLLTAADWFDSPADGEGSASDAGPRPAVSVSDGRPDLDWDGDVGLHLRRLVPTLPVRRRIRLTPSDRSGSDRDRHGVFWVVGPQRQSLWRVDDGTWGQVWPPQPSVEPSLFVPRHRPAPPVDTLGGLAVTMDHHIVVGIVDRPGLLLFDLIEDGLPRRYDWSAAVPDFRPVDCCRVPGGGVLVLDADPGRAEPTRVWRLDGDLRAPAEPVELRTTHFAPCEPDAAPIVTEAAERTGPRPWRLPVGEAIAVEAVDAERYLVLDRAAQQVVLARDETVLAVLDLRPTLAAAGRVDAAADPDSGGGAGEVVPVQAHDIAVARRDGRPILHVSDAAGDEVFTFDVDDGLAVLPDHYVMRRHEGRALVSDGTVVWFDTATGWHPLLSRSPRRHVPVGSIVTAAFDGGGESCRWHRVLLDGCIPDGTAVLVETRAADDVRHLAATPWRAEPRPYRRADGAGAAGGGAEARSPRGTWETLVQRTDGRFCQLRITFEGSGGASPEVAALRLVYPRFSYLHAYLPDVYADRDRPSGFLERYLANPEGMLTEIEERIAGAELLLDARAVPDRYLDWLASWFATVFDADLAPARRRLFLENAMALFARRGTVPGLVAALRLVLDPCPEQAFDDDRFDDGAPPYGIRIAERFWTRELAAPLPGGPLVASEEGPVAVGPAERWTAAMGANALHQRFRDYLVEHYGTDWSSAEVPAWLRGRTADEVVVPAVTPDDPGKRADWQRFLGGQLGLRSPAFDAGHLGLYRRFLLQRYGQVGRFVAAHGLSSAVSSFDEILLPSALASFGPALVDWEAFVTLVVPIAVSAHRFTVLVPVEVDDPEDHQLRQLDLARRVVEVEKPAHTTFDVRPYWAAFQLGDARLGLDTQLGPGARIAALVLDRDRLAHSALSGGPHGGLSDRHQSRGLPWGPHRSDHERRTEGCPP